MTNEQVKTLTSVLQAMVTVGEIRDNSENPVTSENAGQLYILLAEFYVSLSVHFLGK